MGASSTEGTGYGACRKATPGELAVLANGPAIIFAGVVEANESLATSPPTNTNAIVFPHALPGGSENYVVLLTTVNAGYAYVSDLDEVDGDFSGFSFIAEAEGTVMYMVSKVGSRASI